MTVVREGEDLTVQTDGPQLSRTFAMTLVSYGYGVVAAGLAYFLVVLALPLAGEPGAPPIPLFVAITAIFAVIGAVSVVWSGARRRAWFWLGAALPGLLILLMNAPFILHDITRPANTNAFLVTIVVLSGGLAVIVGGIAAFLEVRRGRPAWTRSGRAGWVSIAVIGALAGCGHDVAARRCGVGGRSRRRGGAHRHRGGHRREHRLRRDQPPHDEWRGPGVVRRQQGRHRAYLRCRRPGHPRGAAAKFHDGGGDQADRPRQPGVLLRCPGPSGSGHGRDDQR